MRPKLLEIEGLQSFREVQTIDFATLGETGLFGIFGPTGSGKSTILDAVTFALYGDVKRAKNGTQGIININQKTVRVSFTFELLRDGARRSYRVERVYQRKKGSENASESKLARLIEIADAGEIPLCDKANDVTNKVQELIGLNQTDFTRAVVLPQNSFQEFLLLGNSERRGMLERIFYLEEYGKELWEKLNRKMAGLNGRILNLSGELKGYEEASDEALEAAKKSLDEAAADREAALKEYKAAEAHFNEAKDVWNLVQEIEMLNEKERLHLQVKDEIAGKRIILEKAIKAESVTDLIRNAKELNGKLEVTTATLGEIETRLPEISAMLEKAQVAQEELKNETALEQPRLVERRARLQDALGLKAEMAGLETQISESSKKAGKIDESISFTTGLAREKAEECARLEKELLRLDTEAENKKISPEYRKEIQAGVNLEMEERTLAANLKDLEKKAKELEEGIHSAESEIGKVRRGMEDTLKLLDMTNAEKNRHDSLMPEDKKELQGRIDRLHGLEAVYQVLAVKKAEIDLLAEKAGKQGSDLEGLAAKNRLLNEEREKAYSKFEACRAELDAANAELAKNAAQRLSKELREGEPCPVCGSTHHPGLPSMAENTDTGILEQHVRLSAEKLAEAENDFKKAEKACLISDEQLRSLFELNAQVKLEWNLKTKSYASEAEKLPEALRGFGLDALRNELERMNRAGAEKLKALEAWETEREGFKDRLLKINNDLSELRISENGLAAGLKVMRDNLADNKKSLAGIGKSYAGAHSSYEGFLRKYSLKSASDELARILEADEYLNAVRKNIAETQRKAADEKNLAEKYKNELQALSVDKIRLESEIKNLFETKKTGEAKVREIAGEAVIEKEIENIGEKLVEYSRREKELQEAIRNLEKSVRDLESSRALLANQKKIYAENLEKEESRLTTLLAERGFASADEAETSVIPPDRQKELKRELDNFDQAGLNILAQKTLLGNKIGSRGISEEEWIRMSGAWQEISAHKEECVSRSDIAVSRYRDIEVKHKRWAEISCDLRGLTRRQGLLEQIKRLLGAGKGSFIDYIAEERLRYVASRASDTLGLMTRYKYALELDAENGFIIRDNSNGGVHRPVTSLSGGETFLTSLSLALALSEQIQLKGQSPLEFFFLDEGFGTLDSSLLDNVMDSLERLSSSERVIGLISHVPELRSRLSRRLVVDPPTTQGEGSRVRIEKG